MDQYKQPYTLCLQTPRFGRMYQPPAVCRLQETCIQPKTYYGYCGTENSDTPAKVCNYYNYKAQGEGVCSYSPRPRKVPHEIRPTFSAFSTNAGDQKLRCQNSCSNVKITKKIPTNRKPNDRETSTQTHETRIITADGLENLISQSEVNTLDGDPARLKKKEKPEKEPRYCSRTSGKRSSRNQKQRRSMEDTNLKEKEPSDPQSSAGLHSEQNSLTKASPSKGTKDARPKSEAPSHSNEDYCDCNYSPNRKRSHSKSEDPQKAHVEKEQPHVLREKQSTASRKESETAKKNSEEKTKKSKNKKKNCTIL